MTARLIGRIAGVHWAIHAPALQTIVELAARQDVNPANLDAWKALMAPRQAVAFRPGAELPGARRATVRDGVAMLSVSGPIFRYANLFTDISGATALSDLAHDLRLARDDSRVRAILLEVDSPGGEADGIAEVADAIRAAGETKPVVAYVDGLAASAGYWLAAAARDVVMSRTAIVGSLGVVAMFRAPKGDEPIEIVSSQTPGKRAKPQTEEGRAAWQALVDRLAEEFLGSIAAYRGVAVEDLLAATGGGGLLVGSDAVAAGMADRLGSFEDTLAVLSAGNWTPPRAARVRAGADSPPGSVNPVKETIGMADEAPPATPVAEDTTTNEQPPAPAPAPEAAAPPAPPADPVAAERARCSAISTAMKPGFGKLAALAVAEGWSPETFAAAQDSSAEAVTAAARGAQAQGFAGTFPAPVAGGGAVDAEGQAPEDKARAAFAADAKLRAEFGTEERYLAFVKAEAAGKVRVLSRRA